jgi:simple sugar transport system ATP-binding protein
MTSHPIQPSQPAEAPVAPARSGADTGTSPRAPILAARDIRKRFGQVVALDGVSLAVRGGEVVCLLGDNGAGKSTLIKILSGVIRPDSGSIEIDGKPVEFRSAHDARRHGISTVYQDLAMIPLMSVTRNFFLGSEPRRRIGPFSFFDMNTADRITRTQLEHMGIRLRSTSQLVHTLSGGERQSLAIARAVYFGARVLILDEPTSALGVSQAGTVLRYILQARAAGIAVIFITHNLRHAYPVGDRFLVLDRGHAVGEFDKTEANVNELLNLMAGGKELERVIRDLESVTSSVSSGARLPSGASPRD